MAVLGEGLREFAVCGEGEIEYISTLSSRFEIAPQEKPEERIACSIIVVGGVADDGKVLVAFAQLGTGELKVAYFFLLLSRELCAWKLASVRQNPERSWCWVLLAKFGCDG